MLGLLVLFVAPFVLVWVVCVVYDEIMGNDPFDDVL